MPLFRHHALLLDHPELTDQPLVGPVFRVRPAERTTLGDRDQAWRLFVDLRRGGLGGVAAELWTSFDAVGWSRVCRVAASKDPSVATFAELPALATFVQIRTTVSPMQGQPASPQHRVTARLASDGPFGLGGHDR